MPVVRALALAKRSPRSTRTRPPLSAHPCIRIRGTTLETARSRKQRSALTSSPRLVPMHAQAGRSMRWSQGTTSPCSPLPHSSRGSWTPGGSVTARQATLSRSCAGRPRTGEREMQSWQQGPQAGQQTQQQGLQSLQAGQQQQQLGFHYQRTHRSRSTAAGCAGTVVCLVIVVIVAYLVVTVR
jgi:hypothetical protein